MTKKITKLLYSISFLLLLSCTPSDDSGSFNFNPGSGSTPCGTYNGKKTYTGPKGGCYYINSNGNKTYVDRSYCC